MKTGRPATSLLKRVMTNSFRADRYGALLGEQPLPADSPFRDRDRIELWGALVAAQRRYRAEPEYQREHARDFGQLVRALHGASPPRWYREHHQRSRRKLAAMLAAFPASPRA